MELVVILLAAYALCFALQHKLVWFHGKSAWTDKMLQCTFCTAFHTGWFLYLLHSISTIHTIIDVNGKIQAITLMSKLFLLPINAIIFGLASSAFAYAIDTAIRLMESHADPIEVEDVEDSEDVAE